MVTLNPLKNNNVNVDVMMQSTCDVVENYTTTNLHYTHIFINIVKQNSILNERGRHEGFTTRIVK